MMCAENGGEFSAVVADWDMRVTRNANRRVKVAQLGGWAKKTICTK
jgi:hypothetical protein